jgi:VWFA-related protein
VLLQRVLQQHKGRNSPLLDNPADPQIDTSQLTPEMAAGVAAFQENEVAFRMDLRVGMTLDALKAIGRTLAGYQGRKKLIWVTASVPIMLEPGENAGFESQRTYANDIIKTAEMLRDAEVSVYTVDAQGLVGSSLADAQFTGRTTAGRMMTGAQLASEAQRRGNTITDSHFSAQMLADGTGGLSFYNRNDLDTAVTKSVADGAVYYALSYSPDDKNWNGQYRKIEVKVNRPGVELRYRKGYFARDQEAARDQSAAAIQSDLDMAMTTLLPATGVTFYGSALPLKAPQKGPEAASAVKLATVRFLVEPRDVFFQESEDKKHCSLQFAVGVFNADKLVNAIGKRLDCNVKPETYARLMHDGILFEVPIEVNPDKARIRLVVRDNFSGKLGSLDIPYPPAVAQVTKP